MLILSMVIIYLTQFVNIYLKIMLILSMVIIYKIVIINYINILITDGCKISNTICGYIPKNNVNIINGNNI